MHLGLRDLGKKGRCCTYGYASQKHCDAFVFKPMPSLCLNSIMVDAVHEICHTFYRYLSAINAQRWLDAVPLIHHTDTEGKRVQ